MNEVEVGTKVKITDEGSSLMNGKTGIVEEGPERIERGCIFQYLVKLDERAANGAQLYVGDRHEIEVLS